ncbi:MAG: hypothetical protein H6737_11300 [Alphaproteobacteria bacterium]|nr:hypothetical protein [Alphaproteobacteria bacterium]
MGRPSLIAALLLLACGDHPVDFDGDGYFSHQDCNDKDPNVNVMAPEIPFDGIDNDCNGWTFDDDGDQDGLRQGEDCNDADASIPGPEVYYNDEDDDCDPSTDDDDQDADGVPVDQDCDDTDPNAVPGNTEIVGDGIDNDCDPSTLDGDLDGDGIDGSMDCDDTDPTVGLVEVWFLDCDGDGFAGEGAQSTTSCGEPPPLVDCPFDEAGWTTVEPVDAPNWPTNTTTDCGDFEPRAFPGQTDFFPVQSLALPPGLRFDYDCNADTEAETPVFQCQGNSAATGCVFLAGFVTTTQCGAFGEYADDCIGTIQCDPDPATSQVLQACR